VIRRAPPAINGGGFVRRRDFVKAFGSATALWPAVALGQTSGLPVIGILGTISFDMARFSAFRQGLKENGYVESRNVAIEPRFAEGHLDWLPELAADLVRRQVTVIVATGGNLTALVAKAATSTIPIVFAVGDNPMAMGLAESLSRPAGNTTGLSLTSSELEEKRLELLRELAPNADVIALILE
jgi:putative ABC transport system substrate-binding protein